MIGLWLVLSQQSKQSGPEINTPKVAALPLLIILFYSESYNDCHQSSCPNQFNCNCLYFNKYEPECIDLSWVCDGIPDCKGDEDERDCFCPNDEFQCNACKRDEDCGDGIPFYQCINMSQVEDGVRDCIYGNDEKYLKVF